MDGNKSNTLYDELCISLKADQEYWDQVGGKRGDPLASSPHLTCSEIRMLSWKEDEGTDNYKWSSLVNSICMKEKYLQNFITPPRKDRIVAP